MQRVETPDLLTFIHHSRRTGLLEMERDGQSTRIFFMEGDPVYASSTKAGLRLGDLLLRVGRISERDLEHCAARHRAAGDRMGQLLVAEKMLTEAELRGYLKVQVSEVIFNSFSWGEGRFAFYDDVAHPPDVITIDINLQNLIMEGGRRLNERGLLSREFPDLDALVESLTNPEWVKVNLSLTPEEWSVFFLVNGRRSLREICQLAGHVDDLTTLEVLKRLQGAKLIRVVSPEPPARSEAAPPPSVFKTQAITPIRAAASSPVVPADPIPPRPASSFSQTLPDPVMRSGDDDTLSLVSSNAVQYAAAGLLQARLVLEESAPPVVYPLQRDAYTLGRGNKNDIVINDLNVSTFHARLERCAAGFKVVDLRSTNGTAINSKRLEQPVVLKANDLLHLGPIRLRYLED